MKRIFLFILGAAGLVAQPIPGHYIVEMDSEPAIAVATASKSRLSEGDPAIIARRARIRAEHGALTVSVRALGGSVTHEYDTVLNGLAIQIPDSTADRLRNLPGVKGVYPEKMWHPALDYAIQVHRITDTWAALPGGAPNAGAGIKIAIFDGGIDVTHPGFQGFTTALPAGFPKTSSDTETANTNNKVIVSRDYTNTGGMDTQGHGTGVAMIAAGLTNSAALDYLLFDNVSTMNVPLSPITGVAPGAWLGNYKVCGSDGCPTSAFLQALQDAVNDGMNVINYSVGGPVLSSSDENGLEARAIRNTVSAGVLVVIAAGDDGTTPTGGQAPGTIDEPAITAEALTVGAVGNSRIFDYAVVIPGMAPFVSYLPDPSNDVNPLNIYDPVTAPFADVAAIDGSGYACSALPAGSLSGKIALIQRSAVGSATACAFNLKLNNAAAAGAMGAVVYNSVPDGVVFMQLSDTTLPSMFLTQKDGQALKAQISANPGLSGTLDFTGLTPFPLSSDYVARYSPAGPTPAANIKPDVMAVGGYDACTGDEILTADTLHSTAYPSGCGNGELVNNPAHPYTIESGTSFSAPFVTGSVAVLMAARPGLTAAQYKSLIVNSTPQFTSNFDGSPGTPMITGTGKLDLLGATQNNLTVSPVSVNFHSAAGTVNNTQAIVVTNVGSATDAFTVTVNSIDGSVAPGIDKNTFSLAPGASQTINVTMAGSNLAAGAYDGYLVITGTQTPVATRVAYWFGVPGAKVNSISVLNQNSLGAGAPARGNATILIRYNDQTGLPIGGSAPSVTAVAPLSRVQRVYAVGDIPGTYAIDVQLGRTRNTVDEFDISVGDVTVPVGIYAY